MKGVGVCVLSHVRLFTPSWTVARQAPLSMGILKQEHWNGLSFPFPGDLPDPEIEPTSPRFFSTGSTGKPESTHRLCVNTTPFYGRILSIHRCWYPWGSWDQSPHRYQGATVPQSHNSDLQRGYRKTVKS